MFLKTKNKKYKNKLNRQNSRNITNNKKSKDQ
jgi:hypothetical protein